MELVEKTDLKVELEVMLCATQEQEIRINYVKNKVDKTVQLLLCRMCDNKSEKISHIVSNCEQLVKKEYKNS